MKEKNVLEQFSILTILYIIFTFFIKISELILSLANDVAIKDFSGFIYSNLVAALFVSLCIFLIYFIISLVSKKTAFYTASILFPLMLFSEIGLIIYHKTTGLLMGAELFNRPLWETLLTIKSVTNIWMLLLALLLLAAVIFVFVKLSKNMRVNKFITKVIFIMMFLSVPVINLLSLDQDKNIVNKIWYCLHSNIMESKAEIVFDVSRIEYDKSYIDEYKKLFPNREIINDKFPLERKDNIDNVLGSYFVKSETKPNLVFVIVESLGSDFFGQNEFGYTMTPFLDSLSKHSLLWTNCLSSTPRSAGVIPSVTASVPHGRKGFQFGDIPECNSLFAILKANGYKNNAFYACSFNFDRISDYLNSQRIDYMSPFKHECNQTKDKLEFDYMTWGYHDKKMFERCEEVIDKRNDNNPNFDMFITISQHDNKLVLKDKDLQDYYYDKAESILQTLPENEYNKLKGRKGFIAAFLYGDDALRDFFYWYTKKYDNTIFVITGDHSLNINSNNPLNAFHVPLIVWSPTIKKAQHFYSVVSHNDIAPSICALMRDNYNIKTPETVHWVGDGLDTTKHFVSNARTYFLMQSNTSTNLIYDDLYYVEDNGENNLYKIKDNMQVEPLDDHNLAKIMKKRMDVVHYVDYYTYSNNSITNNPIIPRKNFELINSVTIDSAFCASGKDKPSVLGVINEDIYSYTVDSQYSDIKVVFTADMKYTADISHQHFINIKAKCSNADWYPDVLSKNIIEEDYGPEEWLKLEFTKVFDIKNESKRSKLEFCLTTPEHDHYWNPEHTVLLKNINISILGVNNQ